ncbi:hypothetical protein BaRGS_00032846 [Batillaria attramentaria]|uniref:Mitochondrial transcription termination factor n=1 Tax=Batillaria attramentaria TaxID=370345 RepID=A0ABD0JM46_9CAEN
MACKGYGILNKMASDLSGFRTLLVPYFTRRTTNLFSARSNACGEDASSSRGKHSPPVASQSHLRSLRGPTEALVSKRDGVQLKFLQTTAYSTTTKGKRLPLKYQNEEDIDQILADGMDVMQEFADLLQCPLEHIQQMVRRDTRLVTHFSKQEVLAKMRLLLDHGFDADEITKRYQLFSRSIDFLRSRLRKLGAVKRYRYHLSLLLLSNAEFEHRLETYRKEMAVMGDHPSQISFVAYLLGSSETEVTSLVSRGCHHLLSMRPSRLLEVVNVLSNFSVSTDEIRNKCHMLKCVPDVARTRLQLVHDNGVYDPEKLESILLSSDSQFMSSVTRWCRDAEALGGLSSKREMLMKRLQCSEGDLEDMLLRAPALKPLSPSKLADSLHVLLDIIGLSPTSIVQNPTLLFFSTARLLSRWEILQHKGLTDYELIRALLLPERKFVSKFGTADVEKERTSQL